MTWDYLLSGGQTTCVSFLSPPFTPSVQTWAKGAIPEPRRSAASAKWEAGRYAERFVKTE